MQMCVLCSHGNVDLPTANIANQSTNDRNHQKYEAELVEFEKDKEAWKIKHGKVIPGEPKLMPVYYQCHCYQMACTGYNQGSCQECNACAPTIGKDGECPCKVCQCLCFGSILVSAMSVYSQHLNEPNTILTSTICFHLGSKSDRCDEAYLQEGPN
jgi:hypothetical protein